ncbi:MAG: hypothetical protein HKN21_13800 [Candidatus Eisenbacteria bacterium]|uniref:Uncharacterized protein n=1 Tax=Eiseniibacteriota bacterium TaxID=2212470 RepID=A0A7Y2EBF7_UNCEI|nr:hypothetical protein [Candidatus Eisenbacteria bacterium]
MRKILLATMAMSVFLLMGCSGEKTDTAKVEDAAKDAASSMTDAGMQAVQAVLAKGEVEVEVGCAGCVYKLEGAEGCQTAVKIGDTAMMAPKAPIDAHSAGLCAGPKKAKMKGSIQDGKLVTEAMELQ